MNRRGLLKGLGVLFGSAAVSASTGVKAESKTLTLPTVEEVIQKARAGLDFTDIDALVYANELNRRLGRHMNEAVSNDMGEDNAWSNGLGLWSLAQKNTQNLIKIHPYVKCALVGFCEAANTNVEAQ